MTDVISTQKGDNKESSAVDSVLLCNDYMPVFFLLFSLLNSTSFTHPLLCYLLDSTAGMDELEQKTYFQQGKLQVPRISTSSTALSSSIRQPCPDSRADATFLQLLCTLF